MKSKLLPALAIVVFTATASYSQIPEVMVGDTSAITIFNQPDDGLYQACEDFEFSLSRHVNNMFSYMTLSSVRNTNKLGQGDTLSVLFGPMSSGIQRDTAIFSSWWHCTPPGHLFDYVDSFSYNFTGKGIDSVVVIKIKDPTIFLPIDTQAQKYKSKIEPFFFYSNIADSVLFDSWQLAIDPSTKISFTVDSSTTSLSEYRSKPFTRKKQLNFTFTTSLAATDTAHSFPATMKTRVRYHGVDSIYSNNFTIILPAAPKSGVRSEAVQDISFTINPNPFSKMTTFIVTTPNSRQVTIEINDILGNRKAVIESNEIINGSRAFGFDAAGLAAGSYFARLVCGNEVISKKIIIY